MISKKLLSDVLGVNTIEMNPIYERNNMVGYLVYGPQETPSQVRQNHRQINIHELAHKCKEWAYKQELIGLGAIHYLTKIDVITRHYEDYWCSKLDNGKDLNVNLDFYGLSGRDNHRLDGFNLEANKLKEVAWYANTEPEAIFKACQWILENKETK